MTPVEVYHAVERFMARHDELLAIYAYFLVMALAPELPWPFNRIPPFEWFYELQRHALQSLFASRHPDMEKKVTVQSVEVQTTVGTSKDAVDNLQKKDLS